MSTDLKFPENLNNPDIINPLGIESPEDIKNEGVYYTWLRGLLRLRLNVFTAFRGGKNLQTKCLQCQKAYAYWKSDGRRILSEFYRSLQKDPDFCDLDYIPDIKTRLAGMSEPERVREDHQLVIVDARYRSFKGRLIHFQDLNKFLKSWKSKRETRKSLSESKDTKTFTETFSGWFRDLKISKEEVTTQMVSDLLKHPLFKVKVLHYKHFFREISLHTVSRRLGNFPTKKSIDEYKSSLFNWVESDAFYQLEMVWKTLPEVVKEEIRKRIEKILSLSNMDNLDIAWFLHNSPGIASGINTLCKIEDRQMTKNYLSELYHPDTMGVKGTERKVVLKYTNYIKLTWDGNVDLDLHVIYTTKDGEKHVYYETPSYKGCNLDHDNTKGGIGSTEIISFDENFLIKMGCGKITVYVLCFHNPLGKENKIPFTVDIVSDGKKQKHTGVFDPNDHKCGDNVLDQKMKCFEKSIFLSKDERKSLPSNMRRLPKDVNYLVDIKKLSSEEIEQCTVDAGRNKPVYIYLYTEGKHFRKNITLFYLPGHQVKTSVKTKTGHTIDGQTTICVGTIKPSDIGYIVLNQKYFKQDPASLKYFKDFYKNKVFSPFMSENIRLIMEVLYKKNLDSISNLILSYMEFEEQEIPLFTTVGRIRSGQEWWKS